jgi:hypothetical protein
MSAGQYKDNEDKDVMGYELPRRGEKELVRVSPANRDTAGSPATQLTLLGIRTPSTEKTTLD